MLDELSRIANLVAIISISQCSFFFFFFTDVPSKSQTDSYEPQGNEGHFSLMVMSDIQDSIHWRINLKFGWFSAHRSKAIANEGTQWPPNND